MAVFEGSTGNDNLFGGNEDDTLIGKSGSDWLEGGDGSDTAVFSGSVSDYEFIRNPEFGSVYLGVRHTATGDVDRVRSDVEVLEFDDTSIFWSDALAGASLDQTPDASNDTASVIAGEAVTIDVLANDTDSGAGELSVVSVTLRDPSAGTVEINEDGSIRFESAPGFSGNRVLIDYVVSDGFTNDEAVIDVSVIEDLEPEALDDTLTVSEEDGLTDLGNVLDNDSAGNGDLVISAVNGQMSNIGEAIAGSEGGLFVIQQDGSVTFDPNGDFEALNDGETLVTEVTYTIADEDGDTSVATVQVTVEGVSPNVAPEAKNDAATVNEDDESVVKNLLDNDTDENGDELTVIEVARRADLVGEPIEGAQGGYWIVQEDGRAEFFTDGDFDYLAVGETAQESLLYKVSDGRGGEDFGEIRVTITGSNDDPVVNDDSYTVKEGATQFGLKIFGDKTIFANDSDVDGDKLTVTEVNGQSVSGKSITVEGDNGGTFTVWTDGRIKLVADADNETRYTGQAEDFDYLAAGETAETTISYTVSDGNGGTATANVTMTVEGKDDALDARDDFWQVDNDTTLDNINIHWNDDRGDQKLNADGSVIRVDGSASGVGQAVAGSNGGTFIVNSDGTASFDPGSDFNDLAIRETRSTSVTVTLTDRGGETDTSTLTVLVQGANQTPDATDDTATVMDYDDLTELTSAFDNDQLGDTDAVIAEVNGKASKVGEAVSGSNGGKFILNEDGSVFFDTNEEFYELNDGESVETEVTYTLRDQDGQESEATYTVTVEGFTNEDPNSRNDYTGLQEEEASITLELLDPSQNQDVDGEGHPLKVTAVDRDENLVGERVDGENGGYWILEEEGRLQFFTNGDFDFLAEGETVEEYLLYNVEDPYGGSAFRSVTVTITGENDGPTAVADTASADEGVVKYLLDIGQSNRLVDNDTDPDTSDVLLIQSIGNGDDSVNMGSKSKVSIEGDNGGVFTVFKDGRVEFSATGFDDLDEGETAETSISYVVTDQNGGTSQSTLTVTVDGVADEPINLDEPVNESDPEEDAPNLAGLGGSGDVSEIPVELMIYSTESDFGTV